MFMEKIMQFTYCSMLQLYNLFSIPVLIETWLFSDLCMDLGWLKKEKSFACLQCKKYMAVYEKKCIAYDMVMERKVVFIDTKI